MNQVVERRDAGFYIVGTRIPIDRVVWEYRNGEDPAAIASHYPTLTIEQVIGALAFYEGHKEEVDSVLLDRLRREEAYIASHPAPESLLQKLERARQQLSASRLPE